MPPFSVVIVDNHLHSRIRLRETLRYPELKILGEAGDGYSGLRLLQTLHPDIAILDIDLPGISGITLIQRFKQLQLKNKSLTTKILVLTVQDTEKSVLDAFSAGADSYCLKRRHTHGLVESILITAQGQSWIDPAVSHFILKNIYSSDSEVYPPKVHIRTLPPGERPAKASDLTEREREILILISQGNDNAQIAAKLFISSGTVKSHIRHLFTKLHVDNRTQAVVKALRSGLIS
jgi:DNA-binding NarL/FixJ family response regulator